MAGNGKAGGNQPDDDELTPDEAIADALKYMRLTYTLDYSAHPDSWERPEDYPQLWNIRAYIDAEILELDDITPRADAQGQVTIAEAAVYMVPDIGDVNFFETLDAHSAELSHIAEAFMAAGSPPNTLTIDGQRIHHGDLMILTWLSVEPEFCGHRTGHQILKAILKTIGRDTVVAALHAAPELRNGMEEGSLAHRRETKALAKYWSELGFRRLNGDVVVLSHDDMTTMLNNHDHDHDIDVNALRNVPLLQMTQKERDAVFKNIQDKLDN